MRNSEPHGIYLRDLSELTATERKLLEVYASNPTRRMSEIAEVMELSPKTVSKYAQHIREKLYVNTLAEALEAVR